MKEKINGTIEDVEGTKKILNALITKDERAHSRYLMRNRLEQWTPVENLRDEEDINLLRAAIVS